MFSRVLCVFCLLASPALGSVDIFEDTTYTPDNMPGFRETLFVHGDAHVTIDAPDQWFGAVHLLDSASLTLNDGVIDGAVNFKGQNALVMNDGFLRGDTAIITHPDSTATVELRDGRMNGWSMSFTGGTGHQLSIWEGVESVKRMGFTGQANFTFRGYAEDPIYAPYPNSTYIVLGPTSEYGPFAGANWELYSTVSRVAGDVTGDGLVDLADMNAVRNNFGGLMSAPEADTFPLNGVIDLDDLNRVRNHFGDSQPVPEPSSILLAIVSVAGMFLRQRRHRA